MLATAGCWALAVTQSMPAMTPELLPEPEQSRTRTATRIDVLGHPPGRTADGPGDMGAVAMAVVAVLAVTDRVGAVDARPPKS